MTSVYFIKNTKEHIKIGIASNLKNRLSSIQTSNSEKVNYLFHVSLFSKSEALHVEKLLHKALFGKHVRGEWFCCDELDIMLQLRALNLHNQVVIDEV